MATMFSEAQIDQIVKETIPANTDSTHSNAIVAAVDINGAKVVAHFEKNLKGHWVLNGNAVAEHEWNGDNGVGANVVLKW